MSATSSASASPPAPRSLFVTLLAWAAIAVGGLLTPVSALASLMLLARGYGSSTFDPMGFLTVVVGPPAAVVTGIGLLRRGRWARFSMLAILAVVLAHNVRLLLRGATPERRYVSPSGVPTTVLATPASTLAAPAIAISAALIAMLLSRRVRSEFSVADTARRPS